MVGNWQSLPQMLISIMSFEPLNNLVRKEAEIIYLPVCRRGKRGRKTKRLGQYMPHGIAGQPQKPWS